MSAPASAVAFFRRRLRNSGTAERAAGTKAYLKSDLKFYGSTLATVRAAVLEYCRSHFGLTATDVRAIAEALYATNVHELRSAGIGVVECNREALRARDLPWLIELVRRSDTWAHVDWIAPKVIGDIINRQPHARTTLKKWVTDENFWVRRAVLLADHDALRAGRGDFAFFAGLAAEVLEEREFFIRKAVGWVLREVSKKRPQLTYGFLREHRDRVSRLSLQEGAKYLSAAQRKALGLPGAASWGARGKKRKARP